MKLDTANKIRIAIAFLLILLMLSLYWPKYGLPFAILWGGIVLWQWIKKIAKRNNRSFSLLKMHISGTSYSYGCNGLKLTTGKCQTLTG